MNVHQKILEVKKLVKCFMKDAETSGKGAYSYISGSQILIAVKETMEAIGLLFLPVGTEHRSWSTFNYKNSYGDEKTDFIVEGKLIYEWINVEDPSDRQRVEFEYYGQQNDISKAFGSALTYSERYLLLKSLGAPTDEEDPDTRNEYKNQSKPKNPPKNEKEKTKWAMIQELIKNTEIELASVQEFISATFGRSIPINNLTDEQFKKVYATIKYNLGVNDEQ